MGQPASCRCVSRSFSLGISSLAWAYYGFPLNAPASHYTCSPTSSPPAQVLACPPDTELVFYGPQALLVEASVEPADTASSVASSSMDGGDALSSTDSDGEAPPDAVAAAAEEPQGFGALSVMRRGGLRPAKELRLKCSGEGGRQALADVAVSGESRRWLSFIDNSREWCAETLSWESGAACRCWVSKLVSMFAATCHCWWMRPHTLYLWLPVTVAALSHMLPRCAAPSRAHSSLPSAIVFLQACPVGSRCMPAAAARAGWWCVFGRRLELRCLAALPCRYQAH